MSVVVRVENVSKKYQLGSQNTGSLKGDFNRWWATRVKKQEDPLLRIGEDAPRTDEFWALRDVSFDIRQGEAFGIIGKNGAGKSTLLKILSRITLPTTGTVKVKGRIASLLEVGTGFNPELSGRENIYLNGSILGMAKTEIKRKFDEIVDFSGVEKFIDTPVKRYSSGMYVRLAFAVAAHLDSEILILDEVLAVGDAEFQKKCLKKMDDVAHKEGRTVIFVSHSMASVKKLCQSAILLEKGVAVSAGRVDDVFDVYAAEEDEEENVKTVFDISLPDNADALPGYAYRLQIEDLDGTPTNDIPVGKPWQVRVFFKLTEKVEHFIVGLGIVTVYETPLRTVWRLPENLNAGSYEVVFVADDVIMGPGRYILLTGLSSHMKTFHYAENTAILKISQDTSLIKDKRIVSVHGGLVLNPMDIHTIRNEAIMDKRPVA